MQPSRVREAAATVWAKAVRAGIIDSRSGKASVTPTPFRNVRRDRCFFVTNAILDLLIPWPVRKDRPYGLRFLYTLLERIAFDNAHQQRREPVPLAAGAPHNRANRRHIVVVYRAAKPVGQQLL